MNKQLIRNIAAFIDLENIIPPKLHADDDLAVHLGSFLSELRIAAFRRRMHLTPSHSRCYFKRRQCQPESWHQAIDKCVASQRFSMFWVNHEPEVQVDTLIEQHIMDLAPSNGSDPLQYLLLVSGDGDFIKPINQVRKHRKKERQKFVVYVLSHDNQLNHRYRDVAQKVFIIGNILPIYASTI